MALKRMDEVWTTTEVMRDEFEWPSAKIVPAGVANLENIGQRHPKGTAVVWAGRMSQEKNPDLFLDVMKGCTHRGLMFGDGEMRQKLSEAAPTNVNFPGWCDPQELWNEAGVFLGTSHREAFGRSAVEAAARGIPVILTKAFGAAPLIYTDAKLREQFILDANNTSRWRATLNAILTDDQLRNEVSNHVKQNALKLTMKSSVEAINEQLTILLCNSQNASEANNR
ncbi:glycosyltransferase family 4 protein [Kocuria nitroreducens]|uniref:glycosyltransferase family 4 protein n=1 Tax=Kocuria nitroreducens TaxID=3058914 RepID=UPI0036DE6645